MIRRLWPIVAILLAYVSGYLTGTHIVPRADDSPTYRELALRATDVAEAQGWKARRCQDVLRVCEKKGGKS